MTDHSTTLFGTLVAAVLVSIFLIGCGKLVGAEKTGSQTTWLQGAHR